MKSVIIGILLAFSWGCSGAISPLPYRSVVNTTDIANYHMPDTIARLAHTMFLKNLPNEEAICMYGSVHDDTLKVDKLVRAHYAYATERSIVSDSADSMPHCELSRGYLGVMHNHTQVIPVGYLRSIDHLACAPSEGDLNQFSKDNDSAVLVVWCGNGWLYIRLKSGGWSVIPSFPRRTRSPPDSLRL